MTTTHRYTSSSYDLEIKLEGAVFGVELSNETEYWGGHLACSNTEGQVRWLRWTYDEPEIWSCVDMVDNADLFDQLIRDGAIWDGDYFQALPVDTIETIEVYLEARVLQIALDR